MSVAALQRVPNSSGDWLFWSHQHWLDHEAIAVAIAAQGGPAIWVPPLDPMPRAGDPLQNWLSWHQQLHLNMNNATGQQSQDLQSVDLQDPNQLAVWIELDWQEHQNNHEFLAI